VVAVYKLSFSSFGREHIEGFAGLFAHLGHEWVVLVNLGLLLLGFDVLAHHFWKSEVPQLLPRILPRGWRGPFTLLVLVFVLSSFLDNIAASIIGGTIAMSAFKGRVHVGYIAAIVAASNAGGSGSVVGDTTTTMMWISGKSPLSVLHAYAGAVVALVVSGVLGARQQQAHQPIVEPEGVRPPIKPKYLAAVGLALFTAMGANITVNAEFPQIADSVPFLGMALWAALLLSVPVAPFQVGSLVGAAKGAGFLLSLVLCASMMPVEELPLATWLTTFALGFVSALFDNIPLTALAIEQGGYDWGVLAYAVGYGGSMIWFGSSAGVAISGAFPEARSARAWLWHGYHVVLAYIAGYFVLLALMGWRPE
jgi:Na+/H+ antiporter NhaD/arsenite permease-like protein